MNYLLTPDNVRGLAKHLAKKHNARLLNKDDAAEMRLLARVLDFIGVMDGDVFMKNYAITIPRLTFLGVTQSRIYLPYEIGVTGSNLPSLQRQVENIGHEFHHVRQDNKDPQHYPMRYVFSRAGRAHYEARAKHVSMECRTLLMPDEWNQTKIARALPIKEFVDSLRAYALREEDLESVRKHLEICKYSVVQRKIYNTISKDVKAYLDTNARPVRATFIVNS